MSDPRAFRRENWKLFKKRGPVKFTGPRAECCRLNWFIINLLDPHEILELDRSRERGMQSWITVCNQVEERLLEDELI